MSGHGDETPVLPHQNKLKKMYIAVDERVAKGTLKTAEAVYKNGDLSVAAEISHNAEKEANLAGGNRRSVWILVDLDVILWYD